PKTTGQTKQNQISQDIAQEQARGVKRVVGRISVLDPKGTGHLVCTVRVADAGTGHIYGGGSGIPLIILDDPMDILQRFGEVRPGMRVEVFYTGQIESPQAYVRIIGPAVEGTQGLKIESNEIISAPTLPFEPVGF